MLHFALAACIAPCFAAEGWIHDDMAGALKQAQEQGKGLVIAFTGSDWCGPCMQLKKETLAQPDFIQKASASFVLLELDFPRGKKQSEEVKAANRAAAAQYKVPGYPKMVFTDAQGQELESFVGYRPKYVVEQKLAKAQAKLPPAPAAAGKEAKADKAGKADGSAKPAKAKKPAKKKRKGGKAKDKKA